MPDPTAQLAVYVENVESAISKLARYCKDVADEEMEWSPSGLRNSLSWIIRHCAALVWASYAHASGKPIPDYVRTAGVASSVIKGIVFSPIAGEKLPSGREELHEELERAWGALKAFLEGSGGTWETQTLVFERKERTIWALLWHNVADIFYHTGQASYWRRLLAVERRRRDR